MDNKDSKRKANSDPDSKSKKNKSYMQKKADKALASMGLEIGMKGFYITGERGRERKCAKEVIFLLDKYKDKLYPQSTEENEAEVEEKEEKSIEDSIQAELLEMKKKRPESVFKPIFTDTECITFIQSPPEFDVVKIAMNIMQDCATTKSKDTRYTSRIVPIEATCKADIQAIEKTVESLAQGYLNKDAPQTTFMIETKVRNNQSVNKDQLIQKVASVFGKYHKVDLKNPKLVILAEVFRGVCVVSILKDFVKLRKYNIISLYTDGFLNKENLAPKAG
ncbi:hypothetical protein BB560_003076 [Smittium megazygosporum]|uniref:THUMP domain-containing protein n=1 Tax=Smittium megazygosporum TaxID=133381 RepID=A0A2T9ZD49_9FUNG|nr:hypothetical protein BB560_003076 [Smittium megazygosporum]